MTIVTPDKISDFKIFPGSHFVLAPTPLPPETKLKFCTIFLRLLRDIIICNVRKEKWAAYHFECLLVILKLILIIRGAVMIF